MPRITPKYRKGETEPYAYNIRVYRGTDATGKQLSPYQQTWRIPEGWTDQKRIKRELDKVVAQFSVACGEGKVSVERRTVSQYMRDYLEMIATDNKIKTQVFHESMMPRIDEHLGNIKLRDLTAMDLNRFYGLLKTKDVRKDKKARAKDRLLDLKAEQKITHAKLRDLTGLSENTIRLACQQHNINIESAQKIAAAMKMPMDEVFDVVPARPGKDVGLSSKTVQEYHRFLHAMLAFAAIEGSISNNPADIATPPKREQHEAEWFEMEEIMDIRDAIEQEPMKYRVMFVFLAETGMRRGELMALRWDDIDWDRRVIHIRSNLQYTPKTGIYENTPKGGKGRKIKVSPDVLDYIREYKADEEQMREMLSEPGRPYNPENYLFHREDGSAMHPDSLYHWMRKVEARYNLPHLHPHKLRHSQASMLYADNVDVVSISKRLGHAQVSTTQNVYAHLMDRMEDQACESITNALWRRRQ